MLLKSASCTFLRHRPVAKHTYKTFEQLLLNKHGCHGRSFFSRNSPSANNCCGIKCIQNHIIPKQDGCFKWKFNALCWQFLSTDSTTRGETVSNAQAELDTHNIGKDEGKKNTAEAIKDAIANKVKKRQRVDVTATSVERNFITPVRAMADFLLKPSDLEGLRKTKRRSPYENEPPITVYWRKDVEAKALEVWGSKEQLLHELMIRENERKRYQQNIFNVKRRLRDYRREQGAQTRQEAQEAGLFGSSGRVVITAIIINGTNFILKLCAWMYTGSHSMFSESIHSLADTINQLILAYGIHKSVQSANLEHPYGYSNMKYVASLISGVGIFCVGTGLSLYHGIVGLLHPEPVQSLYWAFFILGGSLISEGATLLVAVQSLRRGAKKNNLQFWEYVFRGQDPSVNVVLMEDLAAVLGVGVAGACMGLSVLYNSPIPDAVGSLLVGGILGGVASFLIYSNVAALVGRSIPQERLDVINAELESDVMVRAIHDVKGIDIGNFLVRYKAELDFDGRELTRSYLDKQDLNALLEEVKEMKNIDELENFLLKHGENIVDMMGGEIDRIEMKLREKHPEIRHCDLEVL
ncbi:zinc transporter 9 isoform X1 [Schistocerca cancellata]|uniref:zinc transporter 9 isoform X1 n=1 Tax=Schistocerca cancellata TaxID=274614 RepID=UPI0021181FFB|nr:zinc transporter 9 isoform X1 [Schistocerca cancellata]XP_049779100.1 zinc transporter 9 isoform X1 [Schistocerca cancellata]